MFCCQNSPRSSRAREIKGQSLIDMPKKPMDRYPKVSELFVVSEGQEGRYITDAVFLLRHVYIMISVQNAFT